MEAHFFLCNCYDFDLFCSALLSSLPHVCLNVGKDTDFMTCFSGAAKVRGGSEVKHIGFCSQKVTDKFTREGREERRKAPILSNYYK